MSVDALFDYELAIKVNLNFASTSCSVQPMEQYIAAFSSLQLQQI